MGKQRTPQGQRPGRRMPVRRAPAGAAGPVAAGTPPEARPDPETDQARPDQDVPPAETVAEVLEAAPASSEATAEAEPQAAAEPVAAAPEEVAAEEAPAGSLAEEPGAQDAEGVAAPVPDSVPDSVPVDPLPPVAALDAADPAAETAAGIRPDRPVEARAAFRFAFAPQRLDVEGIGVVLANYMHNESVAALSYVRALAAARSPADMMRLNVSEMQRAADASLTCWSDIARRAARSVPLH